MLKGRGTNQEGLPKAQAEASLLGAEDQKRRAVDVRKMIEDSLSSIRKHSPRRFLHRGNGVRLAT